MATLESPPVAARSTPDPDTALARRVLVVAAVLLLAHVPLLIAHAEQLWERPHYQFFPVLLLGALVLAFRGLRDVGPLTPGSAAVAYPLLAVAWLGLLGAELVHSSWLAAVATQLVLLAALFAVGGGALLRRLLPAWILLWLAVPPPFNLDRTLVLALQGWTARWSSMLLDLLGIWHVMAGNVVEVAGRRLLVEEACSGVNSLFSVLACTLFFVFWARRRPVHAVLLLVAAVAWVLVANVARVVLVTTALTRWQINLVDGWRHDAVGFALFVVALGFIWSTDRLLLFFFGRRAEAPAVPAPAEGPAAAPDVLGAARRTWLASWAVAGLYGALLLAHVAFYGPWDHETAGPDGPVSASLGKMAAATLPARVGEWQQKDFGELQRNPGSNYGEFSKVWVYQQGPVKASLSFDYPFFDRHDLRECYSNQGWALGESIVHPDVAALEVKMTRPGYRSGHLWFCEIDSQGTLLKPRRTTLAVSVDRHGTALQRLWGRVTGGSDGRPLDPVGRVYQFQLFTESYLPLTEAQRAQAKTLFVEGVRRLQKQWSGAGQASARAN